MGHFMRRITYSLLSLFVFLHLLAPFSVLAETITVSTTSDLIANDGQCTLREAIIAANTNTASGGATGECVAGEDANTDTIILSSASTYSLTIVGTGEDASATGDLDILNNTAALDMIIQVDGVDRATIRQTTNDRVFHIGPAFSTVSVEMTEVVITGGNLEDANGGGIFNQGANLTISDSVIRNNTVTRNITDANGGGLASTGGAANVNISNSVISNNHALGNGADGGGISVIFGSTMSIVDSFISNNDAANEGGGIYNMNGNSFIDIINTTIENNQAASGGGIRNFNAATINMTNSSMTGNQTTAFGGRGGAIFNGGSTATFNIESSQILNNFAIVGSGDGGAIYNDEGVVNINGSTISGNQASSDGGGIYNSNSNGSHIVTITNSTISDNQATTRGGGIFNFTGAGFSTVNVINSLISNNRAQHGGGFYNHGDVGAQLNIRETTISLNVSSLGEGGGIYNQLGTVELQRSTVSSNRAESNSASGGGGGGLFATSNGVISIYNSTFSGNYTSRNGGALNISQNSMTVRNTTIAYNSADTDGGGMRNFGTTTFDNVIIAYNTAGRNDGNCFFTDPVGANNIQTDDDTCGFGSFTDPLLAPLGNYGGLTETHPLLPLSPALDTGDNTICASAPVGNVDQRSVVRPINVTCDIGSFEGGAILPTLSFVLAESSVAENPASTHLVDVILDNTGGNQAIGGGLVVAHFSTTGTAALDNDYSAFPLFIPFGPIAIGATQTLQISIPILDDLDPEYPETIILDLTVAGSTFAGAITQHIVTIISDEVPPPALVATTSPNLDIFDPAISKIGVLQPGQVGLVGEELEWIITVTNNGNVENSNLVIVDNIIPALQVDSVSANVDSIINGQTVTVTIPTLGVGQSISYSIFTTVLESSISLNNSACIVFDNGEICSDALVNTGLATVTHLPETGELPFRRNLMLLALAMVTLLILGRSGINLFLKGA